MKARIEIIWRSAGRSPFDVSDGWLVVRENGRVVIFADGMVYNSPVESPPGAVLVIEDSPNLRLLAIMQGWSAAPNHDAALDLLGISPYARR